MKCSQCGSEDLKYREINLSADGSLPFPLYGFFCSECGHVEFYEPEKGKEQIVKVQQEAEKRKREQILRVISEGERQIQLNKDTVAKLKRSLAKAKAVSEDDNSTMKQVREAQIQINSLQDQIDANEAEGAELANNIVELKKLIGK